MVENFVDKNGCKEEKPMRRKRTEDHDDFDEDDAMVKRKPFKMA